MPRRQRTSLVWSHCTEITRHDDTVVGKCNYCGTEWLLSGSTATALQHLKCRHSEKFSAEERRIIYGLPTGRMHRG